MRLKWTKEKLCELAQMCVSKAEFAKTHSGAYSTAKSRGILNEVCSHMPADSRVGKRPHNKKWSFEKLQVEAGKYVTRMEFQTKSLSAYSSAAKQGILDDICLHMKQIYNKDWNKQSIQEEALKYKNRTDFEKNSRGAYLAAKRSGILNIVCKQMKMSSVTSSHEQELLNYIKQKFPMARSIKDMKVGIPDKPYIKGFEIDIYVAELHKGIEFDGIYWHSFARMRADPGKKDWSDEDIRNYHEIKDAWFATKGIQMLHIKEKDWIKDKERCIKKCLRFLSNEL